MALSHSEKELKMESTISNLPLVVYIPIYTTGRDKYQYETRTTGVYTSYQAALESLFDFLLTERQDLYVINDDSDLELEKSSDTMVSNSRSKITCVDDIASFFGDSYYEDGWEIRIEQRYINESQCYVPKEDTNNKSIKQNCMKNNVSTLKASYK